MPYPLGFAVMEFYLMSAPRCRRSAQWAALAVVVCALSQTRSAVAQSPCDPALPRNEAQDSGYQQRNDRCEGIYKRLVASFGVQLVSLTGSLPAGDLCAAGQTLHLVWPRVAAAPSRPIQLQVESFRRDLNYRLNTDRPPQSSSYEWPRQPRCNSDVKLLSRELGLLARSQSSIGAKPIDVLLPVTLSTQPEAAVRPPYRAVLVPGRRIEEIYVTLWHYDAGMTPARIMFERPLKAQPYTAGGQVVIELSAADVKTRGLYRLVISVEFESGQRETIDRYFIDG